MQKLSRRQLTKQGLFHLGGLILLIIIAIVATILLQDSLNSGGSNLQSTLTYFKFRPYLLFIGSLCITMFGILLSLVVGSLYIGSGITAMLFFALTYASFLKFASRAEPIYPDDLSMITSIKELTSMVNLSQVILILLGLLLVVLCLIALHVWLHRKLGLKRQGWRSYLLRLLAIFATLAGLSQFYEIGSHNTVVAKSNTRMGYTNLIWNQVNNYESNGYVLGFLYNSTSTKMTAPAGYSKNRIKTIVTKYKHLAKQANRSTVNMPKNLNVNLISSESLTDLNYPDIQKYFNFSQDPSPFLTSLRHNDHAVVANMVSDQYGGGTANVEYEVLTGMSNYFLTTSAYQDIIPKTSSYPSFPRALKADGFSTTALHAFSRRMYRRSTNYPILGIDTFDDLAQLKNLKQDPYGQFTTDQSLYNNLYTKWKNHKGSQFNFTLTMQNHMPYTAQDSKVAKSIKVSAKPALSSIAKGTYNLDGLSNYANSVRLTDNALKNLYQRVMKQKRPTLVVLFGDHRPGGVFDFLKNQNELQGYETPVVYFANFDLKNTDLGTTNPSTTIANLYQIANFKRSAWTQMILNLQKQFPVLTQSVSTNSAGKTVTKTQLEKSLTYREYRLVNYDINYGKRYALSDGMFK